MSFQQIQKPTTKETKKGKDSFSKNNELSNKDNSKYRNHNLSNYSKNNAIYYNFSNIGIFNTDKVIQHKPVCTCGGKCPKCKTADHLKYIPIIQTKLKISKQDDPLEKEAERIAEQIVGVNYKYSKIKFDNKTKGKETISRKCSKCEEHDEDKEKPIQLSSKSSSNKQNLEISNETNKEIKSVISDGGKPLDALTRRFMETRFDYDFSNVRIHNDEKATRSAESVNALAYTVANNIIFTKQHFEPNTNEGRKLIAHELTHVIQQKYDGTSLQRQPRSDDEDDEDEQVYVPRPFDAISQPLYEGMCGGGKCVIDEEIYGPSTEEKEFSERHQIQEPLKIHHDVTVKPVPIEALESEGARIITPPSQELPKAPHTYESYTVFLIDEDNYVDQYLLRHEILKLPNYVDNAVSTVGGDEEDVENFTLEINQLKFMFKDNSIPPLYVSPHDIYSSGEMAKKYIKKNGLIFPVNDDDSFAFDENNTPNIVELTNLQERVQAQGRQINEDMSSLAYSFTTPLSLGAGIGSMGTVGRFRGGFNRPNPSIRIGKNLMPLPRLRSPKPVKPAKAQKPTKPVKPAKAQKPTKPVKPAKAQKPAAKKRTVQEIFSSLINRTHGLTPAEIAFLNKYRSFFKVKGKKIVGVLLVDGYKPIPIHSGKEGGLAGGVQRGHIPRGPGTGRDRFSSDHVEGHAAQFMHQKNVKKAILLIELEPCLSCGGGMHKAPNVSKMLPPDAQLVVVGPNSATYFRSTHSN